MKTETKKHASGTSKTGIVHDVTYSFKETSGSRRLIFHFYCHAWRTRSWNISYLFRPPGTVVPGCLMCYCYFFSFLELLHENFPRDVQRGRRDNVGKTFAGTAPKILEGRNRAKFGAILANFRLRSRIYPERIEISRIGKSKRSTTIRHPRWATKVLWTLVH